MNHDQDVIFDTVGATARKAAPATGGRKSAPKGEGDFSTLDIVSLFRSHGLYGRPLAEGKHAVRCPWENEHSGGKGSDDSDTVVWEAEPGQWPSFCCKHSHCQGRAIADVIAQLGDADRFCSSVYLGRRANGAVGNGVPVATPRNGRHATTPSGQTVDLGTGEVIEEPHEIAADGPDDEQVGMDEGELFAAALNAQTDEERRQRIRDLAAAVADDELETARWGRQIGAMGWGITKTEFCNLVRQVQRRNKEERRAATLAALPHEYSDGDRGDFAIDAQDQELSRISAKAWIALHAGNNPPYLFRQGGLCSRIERDDTGRPVIRILTENRLRHVLARVASWYQESKKKGEVPAMPPIPVVRDMLATANPRLPVLTRIVEAPVFAADGTLQLEPGYHSGSLTYYAPAEGLVIPELSARPSADGIAKARSLLLDELLFDFPFAGNSERAHAVALLLLPFVRDMISGPTPLHLIEKPSPGTGAGLLTDVLMLPATGGSVGVMVEGRDEDEWRKRITAKLRSGGAFALIDNLRRRLESSVLCAAITATIYEDRLLGTSDQLFLPVRCVWIATANNPALSSEIARRTVRIRLDAKRDQPWLRKATSFRHPDLRGWATEHRGELIRAALTIIRAWILDGRPMKMEPRLGMFEHWSAVMGGILEVAGIPDFLGNLDEFYQASDTEGSTLRRLISAWWTTHTDKAVGTADLWTLVVKEEIPVDIGDGSERSQKTRLGNQVKKLRDRQFDITLGTEEHPVSLTLRVCDAGVAHSALQWKLEPVKPSGEPGEPVRQIPQAPTRDSLKTYVPEKSEDSDTDPAGLTSQVPQVPQREDFPL